MAPAPEVDAGTGTFHVGKKTWPQLLEHVRYWRTRTRNALSVNSWGSFRLRLANDGMARVYSLGMVSMDRDHSLLYVDVPSHVLPKGTGSSQLLPEVHWKPLLMDTKETLERHILSKEEELLRERMRCTISGITNYSLDPTTGTLLFAAGAQLFVCDDKHLGESLIPKPLPIPKKGAPLDPQLCPGDPNLIAYVSQNDIHLQWKELNQRATFAHSENSCKFAGSPSFIMQEEFDRYSAMWWAPKGAAEPGHHYLLYEEYDEKEVAQLSIGTPATRTEAMDTMRYPLAGTQNATPTLKLLDIRVKDGDSNPPTMQVTELTMIDSLSTLFPWFEYIVRAGWMPEGKGVWVQLMSRRQTQWALVHIPRSMFVPLINGSMQDLSSIQHRVSILYEETNNVWVNYHDLIHFLPSPPTQTQNETKFLWGSERTGYYHLYLVTARIADNGPDPANQNQAIFGPVLKSEVALTSGEWAVIRKTELIVDESRSLIYFLGLKDSPLETHIYVTSYRNPGPMTRLTPAGRSSCCHRSDRTLSLCPEAGIFVCWESNISTPPACIIYKLQHSTDSDLPIATSLCRLSLASSSSNPHSSAVDRLEAQPMDMEEQELFQEPSRNLLEDIRFKAERGREKEEDAGSVPELFTYTSARTGFVHYALLFRPADCRPDLRYPVFLYVYGGPEVQLVRNVWSGWTGFQKYTNMGYAVVMIDGRGSACRGLKFEGAIKHRMGSIEVEDQVEGLKEIANRTGRLLDLNRVAVFGWSYGGYVSLLALAQRPDIFKVAITGGPVTSWYFYDTGYTERYMGLPQEQREAYRTSSVLTQVSQFPDEPGRLLILHGLIDENVHFQHTAKLIEALTRAGKPYDLQIFPRERHGVRSNDANEYMDTRILHYLQEHL